MTQNDQSFQEQECLNCYTIFYSDTKDDFCSVCGLLYEGRRK